MRLSSVLPLVALVAWASSIDIGGIGPAGTPAKYVLSSFAGTYPNDHFKLFASVDGVSWTQSPANYSPALRDPSITRVNGTWWLAHTSIPDTSSFQIASSGNLAVWSQPVTVGVTPIAAAHVWAPEWFLDVDGPHILVAVSTVVQPVGPFSIYELHPTSPDFSTWSQPVAVSIPAETVNAIDPYMVKIGSTYYLWYVTFNGNVSEYIQYGSASSLTGPFTLIKTGNWAGWVGSDSGVEGPCLIHLSDRWRMYLDQRGIDNGQFQYSDSFDSWATWTTKQPIQTGTQAKHGTVFPL